MREICSYGSVGAPEGEPPALPGGLDDAIARAKKIIRQLKGGEFDGVVMNSQQVKAFFASLKNLEGTGLSLESATQEMAAA